MNKSAPESCCGGDCPSDGNSLPDGKSLPDSISLPDDNSLPDGDLPRRSFLKLAAVGTAAAVGSRPVMAGPFENTDADGDAEANEYRAVIPADKRLDPKWVRALYERGEKQIYSDPDALRHIGMPVGGLFAGTVYLSGDGRLWLWDIFNRDQEGILPRKAPLQGGIGNAPNVRSGLNYIHPAPIDTPFEQGFSLRVGGQNLSLDLDGFSSVTFDGRYPIGRVTYRDDASPVSVTLEAFSPFIPLQLDDSSLPATVMHYTLRNDGSEPVEAELSGYLQNPVCRETRERVAGQLRNRVVREAGLTALTCGAEPAAAPDAAPRPDVPIENFEKPTYEGWTVEGTAFGAGPAAVKEVPAYQGDVGGAGERVVNSHATAPGENTAAKDAHVGRLLSKPFTLARHHVGLLIGGGAHRGNTCVNVLVGERVIATATGRSDNRMHRTALDVRKYEGQEARLEIVDRHAGAWGNIGVDEIVLTDRAPAAGDLDRQRDFGTMALALLGEGDNTATASRGAVADTATANLHDALIGEVGRRQTLQPGETATVTFLVAWHFPNFSARGLGGARVGHSYGKRFASALDVARYLGTNFERLAGETRAWVETWYDSSLPYWLLDRTMANTSTLATTTCYRLADGRFWAWEGVGCCPGTCTHVWHYAQAPGRLFPALERDTRERVDFGIGQHVDGGIGHRAGLRAANHPADDGHCGRILGAFREHQMAADDAFLRRIWPRVKRAVQFLIRKDGNADGMIEGAQHNTLDAAWFGQVPFLASLYLAALQAGAAMADEMGDAEFARTCREIAARGSESILACYDGEYFVQREDPRHKNRIGVGTGCYIDQVFGQTWAHSVGLGRLLDRDKQLTPLRALWKYNFVPDIGPFREKFPRGRWYAMAGDAGLLMCTWPKGGRNPDFKKHWQYIYFNECMSGFEWQVAAHMLWEGLDQPDLLQHGLAIGRAIHDRYDAALRNPYNEIECSDHYSRAMASYGVFLAACGFHYHGSRGELGFAPRLAAEDFKAPLVTAEGWGTYEQRTEGDELRTGITLSQGRLTLRKLTIRLPKGLAGRRVDRVLVDGRPSAAYRQEGDEVVLTFDPPRQVTVGAALPCAFVTA